MILQADKIIADSYGTIYSPGRIRISEENLDSGNAKILKVGSVTDIHPADNEEIRDYGDHWLMPGLIQSHIHLNQTLFRGFTEGFGLLEWLQKRMYPFEASHNESSVYASARQSIIELLLTGTTAALTIESSHHTNSAFRACEELGIRAVIGNAWMDKVSEAIPAQLIRPWHESLEESWSLHSKWKSKSGGRLQGCVAPRFALSCSEEALIESKRIALQNGLIWHTHASETQSENDVIYKETGKSNIEYFKQLDLLDSNTSLAHCIWLADSEVELIGNHKVNVLHCPSTNLKMASGIADTIRLEEAGATISIASDGSPVNNRFDVWQEMRLAALLASNLHSPENITHATFFRWATEGGASALGMKGKIGMLRAGYLADCIAVDPYPYSVENLSSESLYTHLVFGLSSASVRSVYVGGREVVRDQSLLTGDKKDILQRFSSERQDALKRANI
ncbi:amidohydrolase family protein [bacterium]|nr:amidohydrolase family protein [bacterium]